MRRVLCGCTRAIGPIDAIQPLAFGPLDPVGNRGDADSELAGDGTQATGRAGRRLPWLDDARLDALLAHGIPS